MKTFILAAALSASFLGLNVSSAAAAEGVCMPVGGTALGQFFDEGNEVIGAMSGTFAATRWSVLSMDETETGFAVDMAHAFSTARGGVVRTKDKIVLTRIEGMENEYALDITYTVDETFGHLKGYTGSFNSFGRLNLATGEGLVRYSGQICK